MKDMVIGLVCGVFGGGFLSYLYASYVMGEYTKAASEVGVFFQKVEGKWTAVRKLL